MNVRADFSDMYYGDNALLTVFVCRQGNLYKLITLLQSVPDLLLTVMKSANGNAVSLAPASHTQSAAAALLDLT